MGHGRRYPRGWYRFKTYILERDGHRCQNPECGKAGRLEISHILSVKARPDLELVADKLQVRSADLATYKRTGDLYPQQLQHGGRWWRNYCDKMVI